MTLPLANAALRLRGRPGRPKTRPEPQPPVVVQVAAVGQLPPRLLDVAGSALYLAVAEDTVRELASRGAWHPGPSGGVLALRVRRLRRRSAAPRKPRGEGGSNL